MLSTAQWSTIRGLVDWLDDENGCGDHEIAMRLMKITEEAGEVTQAYSGMHGQNPRKGLTHSQADVADELCDVIVTAAVALASLVGNPEGVLTAKLAKIADRAALTGQPKAAQR
jgi:NTP pyrophosphatase (non-canonical NTP hydrolase)